MIELRKEDMLNINGGANAILITTIIICCSILKG